MRVLPRRLGQGLNLHRLQDSAAKQNPHCSKSKKLRRGKNANLSPSSKLPFLIRDFICKRSRMPQACRRYFVSLPDFQVTHWEATLLPLFS